MPLLLSLLFIVVLLVGYSMADVIHGVRPRPSERAREVMRSRGGR